MMAGGDVTIGRTVSFDQALQVKDQWKEGRLITKMRSWVPLNAQQNAQEWEVKD
jgi:hypothetical protein